MKTTSYSFALWGKCAISLLAAFAFTALVQGQNVTISGKTGQLICAKTYDAETGFNAGFYATWKHDQLPLTFTASDFTTLTEGGQLQYHTNNLAYTTDKSGLIIMGGTGKMGYFTVTLPKGFRFTNYKILAKNNISSIGSLPIGHNNNTYLGETDSKFQFTKYVNLGRRIDQTKQYTLERTSTPTNPMSNILYFKLANSTSNSATNPGEYMAANIVYMELTFTPEAPFVSTLAPTDGQVRSTAVSHAKLSYSTGKLDLGKITVQAQRGGTNKRPSYVYNDVKDLTAAFDLYEEGCVNAGAIDDSKGNKSISAVKLNQTDNYWKLKPGQIYYLESPTSAPGAGGTTAPLYYRITKTHFQLNEETLFDKSFYIIGSSNNYLNYTGRSLQYQTTKSIWYIDSQGKVYTTYNGTRRYLVTAGTNDFSEVTTTSNADEASLFQIDTNGIYKASGTDKYYIDGFIGPRTGKLYASIDDTRATTQTINEATKAKGTLRIYKANGTDYEDVNTSTGSYTLTGLNNDAIKMEVIGNNNVLVNFDVEMQVLNPYINHMEIFCRNNQASMSRTFTSNDFSVGGGKFYFYIPEEWSQSHCRFTFENLQSKYSDETYPGGSINGSSRYSFVKSAYYDLFGTSQNNIYNNRAEAANHSYTDKVLAIVAGTTKFKFNNAADIDNLASGSSTYFQEYTFSLEKYTGQFNPVGITPTQTKTDYQTNAYVFTTDETRYNIAPTTTTQHRAYAYYNMEIHLEARNYAPTLSFEKVYNSSFYGNGQTNALYGASVSVVDGDGKPGFVSAEQVNQLISSQLGQEGNPASMDQILYVDLSNQVGGTYANNPETWSELRSSIAKNGFIFLPKNEDHNDDNFAYAEEGGTMKASRNIILTDQEPFYTPYKIRVDAANYVTYTRKITGNNKVARKATLFLPFALSLEQGIHRNTNDNCSFTVYSMDTGKGIQLKNMAYTGADHYSYAHFIKKDAIETTEANQPYMIEVAEDYTPDAGTSFTVDQYGAEIMPTTEHKNKGYIEGETSNSILFDRPLSLSNRGTYAGEVVAQVFYFGNNKYFNSLQLTTTNKTVKVRPFRSYYAQNNATAAAMLNNFDVLFDDIPENTTTSIETPTEQKPNLAITVVNGTLTCHARKAQQVRIFSARGLLVNQLSLTVGDTQSVTLPAGLYIINGTKILIK